MGQKEHFWPKTTIFWPKKRPKSRKREFSPRIFFRHFLKDQKLVPMAKIRKKLSSVWEKWDKKSIFGQKRPHFGQKSQI